MCLYQIHEVPDRFTKSPWRVCFSPTIPSEHLCRSIRFFKSLVRVFSPSLFRRTHVSVDKFILLKPLLIVFSFLPRPQNTYIGRGKKSPIGGAAQTTIDLGYISSGHCCFSLRRKDGGGMEAVVKDTSRYKRAGVPCLSSISLLCVKGCYFI